MVCVYVYVYTRGKPELKYSSYVERSEVGHRDSHSLFSSTLCRPEVCVCVMLCGSVQLATYMYMYLIMYPNHSFFHLLPY